ncbi:hypothetical protein BROUX41_001776 [Berkeleyomyces rouxiae]|uniref:uncharacterized protein n=1 Tax=Berkeleyomyces rouxiae TaxID=2035830 RepID=UPI003B7A3E46
MRFSATFTTLTLRGRNLPRTPAPDESWMSSEPIATEAFQSDENDDDDDSDEIDDHLFSPSTFNTATLEPESTLELATPIATEDTLSSSTSTEHYLSSPPSRAYYAWVAAPVFFFVLLAIIGTWEFFFFQRRKKLPQKPVVAITPSSFQLLSARRETLSRDSTIAPISRGSTRSLSSRELEVVMEEGPTHLTSNQTQDTQHTMERPTVDAENSAPDTKYVGTAS